MVGKQVFAQLAAVECSLSVFDAGVARSLHQVHVEAYRLYRQGGACVRLRHPVLGRRRAAARVEL